VFLDARQLPADQTIETGVCIVGAGAAGITLACALAGGPLDVCMVESGGFDLEPLTQSLYAAENIGLPYFPLDANRQRSFGGSTNLWAGWCRPLDAIDFTPRAWVPQSGWPIAAQELASYYQRAHDLCELEPCAADAGDWQRALPTERVVGKRYRLSPPTRFGQKFREPLDRARNVRILLHANAMRLDSNDTARLITRLCGGCLSGSRFSVKARHYVLAAGAVENARLLLVSNAVQASGLGNQHDAVGRYFMEHIHFPAATLALADAGAVRSHDTRRMVTRLALSAATQAEHQVLNHSAMLAPIHWYDRLVQPIARRVARRVHPLRDRLPAAFDPGVRATRRAARHWRLHLTIEQAPHRDSRVILGTEHDALAMPRVRLEWRTTALDQRVAARLPQLIGQELERAGLGRLVRVEPDTGWPPAPLQGLRGHHMGTTRMSTQPRDGVVDAQCRVHGIDNLFIAGSSVFPTAGAGTPTLTIVALALRLAAHLKAIYLSRTALQDSAT
jgi:choline dehydrogenase-like flavoprotein